MIDSWKKAVCLWSLLALLLVAGAPVQAGGGQGHDDGDVVVEQEPKNKDLVRVKHIFRRARPEGKGGGGGGGGADAGYKLAPWKWKASEVEYFFFSASLTGTGLDVAATETSLLNGFAVWREANGNAPLFDLNHDTTSDSPAIPAYDGVNALAWQDLGAGTTIAVTYTWYSRKTKEAVHFDMAFNTRFAWSNVGASDAMDVQNIAAHEAGHVMGLDHATPADNTMYAYADEGETQKRDLAPGDVAGINARYP